MLYRRFRFPLAALVLTVITLTTACGGTNSSASTTSEEAASAVTEIATSENSADAAIATSSSSSEPSPSEPPQSAETNDAEPSVVEATKTEITQAEIPAYATELPRKLNPAELGWVERNWPEPNPEIVIDHSFWLTLRDLGEVAFVTTQTVADPKAGWNVLTHSLMLPNGEVSHQLPVNEDAESWTLWEMKAVAFMELDFDGSEPDAIAIAEYITGVGPTGSQPFPVTTVYFNQGDHFTTDQSINRLLTERGVATVAEAEAILRNELQFLP